MEIVRPKTIFCLASLQAKSNSKGVIPAPSFSRSNIKIIKRVFFQKSIDYSLSDHRTHYRHSYSHLY